MSLVEFFAKYIEIIIYIFSVCLCLFIGYSIGRFRTYDEDKELEEYEELKRENEILKESISIKKKRK